MSDNIEKMDFKRLRNEVQLLRDELAIMQRKYEDILYNLDDDNFSTQFKKSKVSKEDLSAYTTLEQTADAIKTQAYASADLSNAEFINDLSEADDTKKTYYIVDENKNKTYYYYNKISKEWEKIVGGGIDTVFEQTAYGFKMKGNVLIDGDTVVTENLKLSGNVTWDMSNSPVKTRYSADKTVWHEEFQDGDKWLQMSFDGGKNWTEPPTKVVGTDGKNGTNGTNATVTPQSVFDALTADGANQGIFAAFSTDEKKTKIYINSEYLATKIAEVADTLFIGDVDTIYDEKMIKFNESASISTFNTGLGYHIGLEVSTPSFRITGGGLDLTKCTGIEWGKNLPEAGVAVFG